MLGGVRLGLSDGSAVRRQFDVHIGQTMTVGEEFLCRRCSPSYRAAEIPPARRDTHSYLDLYWWKHSIYALLEVDVTRVRQFIEEHEAQTGESLSFTGYLASALGALWMRTSRCRHIREAASTWSSSTT